MVLFLERYYLRLRAKSIVYKSIDGYYLSERRWQIYRRAITVMHYLLQIRCVKNVALIHLLPGYVGSVTDINTEIETGKPSSNFRLICFVQFRKNAFEKDRICLFSPGLNSRSDWPWVITGLREHCSSCENLVLSILYIHKPKQVT